jgi:hypothetical protein
MKYGAGYLNSRATTQARSDAVCGQCVDVERRGLSKSRTKKVGGPASTGPPTHIKLKDATD